MTKNSLIYLQAQPERFNMIGPDGGTIHVTPETAVTFDSGTFPSYTFIGAEVSLCILNQCLILYKFAKLFT